MRNLFLACGLLLSANAAASEDPVAIVEDTTTQLADLVENNRAHYEKNPGELRQDVKSILLPRTDTVYTARLVLGRHGRELNREQIEAFAEALADQLLRGYASALLDYSLRDRVEVLPLSGDNSERMTRVRTRVKLDGGNRAPIDYIFRKPDGEWLVFDVIVEGISYVATFRNQIGQEISRDGFDALMERLRTGELELEVEGD